MNILDRQFRHVICHDGEFFKNYEDMKKEHPEYREYRCRSWKYQSFGDWMLDPYTGECKMREEWHSDWLEDANPAWEGLTWKDVENSLCSVVCDSSDPEGKTFISSDDALEIMKKKDSALFEDLEKEQCINATLQDVWEAFWSCQFQKSLRRAGWVSIDEFKSASKTV